MFQLGIREISVPDGVREWNFNNTQSINISYTFYQTCSVQGAQNRDSIILKYIKENKPQSQTRDDEIRVSLGIVTPAHSPL